MEETIMTWQDYIKCYFTPLKACPGAPGKHSILGRGGGGEYTQAVHCTLIGRGGGRQQRYIQTFFSLPQILIFEYFSAKSTV